MKELALEVSKARIEIGLTPCELANEANVTTLVVMDLENGTDCTLEDLYAIAKVLNKRISFELIDLVKGI